MNDKEMFELFREIHIEEGSADEVIIRERWRLMQPFKGKNDTDKEVLVELMRKYVASMR